MRITKNQLKQIIKEELAGVLGEDNDWSEIDDMFAQDAKERETAKKKKGIPTSIKTSPSVAPEIPGAPKDEPIKDRPADKEEVKENRRRKVRKTRRK